MMVERVRAVGLWILVWAGVQLCVPAEVAVAGLVFDEKRLEKIAETDGYGYKYGNLTLLKELSAEFNQTKRAYKIAVPEFEGIPSQKVQAFLKENGDFDVAAKWGDLVKASLNSTALSDEQKSVFLEAKQYSSAFLDAREVFEARVRQAFEHVLSNDIRNFSFDQKFKVKGVDALISAIAKAHEKFMVRSTGKEDTRKLANAGGNESKANVAPQAKEIIEAMREVDASYFGSKSLTQRLGAGDRSIFDLTPFTPVLIQRMIGETNGQLPKCGVMFSEETEGGISKSGQKDTTGKIRTTGIAVIQAAFGHNEGVVNSLIPVDTFYVDAAKNIYPVIRKKTHRLVPSGEQKLALAKNTGAIVDEPALSKDAVLTLKAFGEHLENYYKYPVDVEFVVREDEKTIYIVQSRPITHAKEQLKPSYLLNVEKIPDTNSVVGSAIGVAGGSVRFIRDRAQIIVKDNIGNGLATYQNKDEVLDPKLVQAVVVGKMAPATSHEATTFRGENKPVIFIPDWQKVEKWAKAGSHLVVSPQQGLVVLGDETSVQKADGWFNYPVPPFVSLNALFKPSDESTITNETFAHLNVSAVRALGSQAASLKQGMAAVQEKLEGTQGAASVKKLFDIMKFGAPQEAAASVLIFVDKVGKWIAARSKGATLDKASQEYLKRMASYIVGYAHNALRVANLGSTSPDFTKRLLPIRFLEALFSQPLEADIVDNISVASFVLGFLGEEQKVAKTLAEKGTPLGFVTAKLALAKDLAMTPELEVSWTNFLVALKKTSENNQNTFGGLFYKLSELDILPAWLNVSFAQVQNKSAEEIVAQMAKEYSSQKDFLAVLVEKKSAIEAFNIAAYDDPKKFETQWALFQDGILNYFVSKEFTAQFAASNDFGKLVALGVMAKFVDTFDRSIKAVTGSVQYKLEDKLTKFHKMLLQYRAPFYAWIEMVKKGSIVYNELNGSLSYFKALINAVLEKQISLVKAMLQATNGFDVVAVTVGNGTNLNPTRVKYPTSYEDVFMTIHQSLLVTLQVLNKDAGINKLARPAFLKKVEEALLSLSLKSLNEATQLPVTNTPSLVGINLEQRGVSLLYNLALRNHSMQYELRYNKNNKPEQVSADVRVFGYEPEKWRQIGLFISNLEPLFFKIPSLKTTDSAVTFEIVVSDQNQIRNLQKSVYTCAEQSLGDPHFSAAYQTLLNDEQRVSAINGLYAKIRKVAADEQSRYFRSLGELLEALSDVARYQDALVKIHEVLKEFARVNVDPVALTNLVNLAQQLVQKGFFEGAIDLVSRNLDRKDWPIYLPSKVETLVIALIERGSEPATLLALDLARKRGQFEVPVEKNLILEKMEQALAQIKVGGKEKWTAEEITKTRSIIEKQKAENAKKAAGRKDDVEYIEKNMENPALTYEVLLKMTSIVRQGREYALGAKVANYFAKIISKIDSRRVLQVVELFTELVKKNQNLDEAEGAADEAAKLQMRFLKKPVEELQKLIREKSAATTP